MKRNKQFPHELIGEEVIVIEATNKSLEGIKGKVVDETKETLTIETTNATKKLLKESIISLKVKDQVVGGKQINKRSEERIKG